MLENIPNELRQLPQWVAAGPNKIPLNPRTGQAADVNRSETWGTFEEAVRSGYPNIGFVLTKNDPFAVIDLDNPEKMAKFGAEAFARSKQVNSRIYESFQSYAELSQSGSGVHIVVLGSIPTGVRRDTVEVYSDARYIICTGNILRNHPIVDQQNLLEQLYAEMHSTETIELVDRDSILDDQAVVDMAMRATNADKFNSLCAGDMADYPSQSEADFALLSIIAFYTPDNEQVRRLFRMSALGKREKATKNDTYLNRALKKIRAQQPPPVDLSALMANADKLATEETTREIYSESIQTPTKHELPPGLVGQLADYFYRTAIRPVPEVALAAAIAIVAGACGRSYNISGSGLNQYIILLAKTGSGKEGALAGIENLIAAIRPMVPVADQFIGPAAFASGQALVKALNERPCFVSVLGEFGLTLQQLSDARANSAQIMLRKVLLDIYAKSGWNRTLRSSVYSDQEKNTKVIQAPNVTILGESTPENFFDGLDASHIAEGLIPRFTVIEYLGGRPPRNRNANIPPSQELAKAFADLITIALTTTNNHTCAPIQTDNEGLALLDAFDIKADEIMNAAGSDVDMQLWNRAHLKALKLAGILAVGVNPHQPIVSGELASWAVQFTENEIRAVAKRFSAGDVGKGDSKQLNDLENVIKSYFKLKKETLKKYLVPEELIKAKLIPYSFLMRKTSGLVAYRLDRMGSTSALKKNIQALIDSGALIEIQKPVLLKDFNFSGIAYGLGKEF